MSPHSLELLHTLPLPLGRRDTTRCSRADVDDATLLMFATIE